VVAIIFKNEHTLPAYHAMALALIG